MGAFALTSDSLFEILSWALSTPTELFIYLIVRRFLFQNGLWIWEGLHARNAELLNLTPQAYTAPLSTWCPPKCLWLREGPGGGRLWRSVCIWLSIAPLWCVLFQKTLELSCGPKACCFFMLAAIAYLMGCNGLLFSLGGGWADAAHGPQIFPFTSCRSWTSNFYGILWRVCT